MEKLTAKDLQEYGIRNEKELKEFEAVMNSFRERNGQPPVTFTADFNTEEVPNDNQPSQWVVDAMAAKNAKAKADYETKTSYQRFKL